MLISAHNLKVPPILQNAFLMKRGQHGWKREDNCINKVGEGGGYEEQITLIRSEKKRNS